MTQASANQVPRHPFNKPWLSYRDQVALLASRGLVIQDPAAAERFLAHVNYYRFSCYCFPFEQSRHVFRSGVTFQQVRAAYEFDQAFRDLVNEALEMVEVDIRTSVAYALGQAYGPFGHTEAKAFHRTLRHEDWLRRARKQAEESNEEFVEHFRKTYLEFPDLPIWMLTEVLSFGSVSVAFKHMHEKDRRSVGTRYGVQPYYLATWFHHLVYIRNICAHHARLWDRQWAIKPDLPTSNVWSGHGLLDNSRSAALLLILNQLMRACDVESFRLQWKARVGAHLAAPPACPSPLLRMGIKPEWFTHPLWN